MSSSILSFAECDVSLSDGLIGVSDCRKALNQRFDPN